MHLVVRQAELLASDGSPWAWCFLGEVIQCLSPWLNYLLETRWERLQWSAETDRRVCSIFSKLAGEKALATWLCLLGGRRLGELQLIISVQDSERSGMIASHDDVTSRKKSAVYTGALLDRLQVLNSDRPHEIHGMVEAQHCGLSMLTNSSETCWSSQAGKHNFGCRNFYYVFTGEIRSAHVYRQVQNMRVSMSTTISTGISIIRLSAKWQAVSKATCETAW